MLRQVAFWSFQLINGLSALAMFTNPRRFHESMLKDPETMYPALGFSPTALEMLHNVIRGQGAALLAISVFLATVGPHDRSGMLLVALVCGLSIGAHVATVRHHTRSAMVMQAIGSVRALYGIIAVNAAVALVALAGYLT